MTTREATPLCSFRNQEREQREVDVYGHSTSRFVPFQGRLTVGCLALTQEIAGSNPAPGTPVLSDENWAVDLAVR